jgi:hypothetical protein
MMVQNDNGQWQPDNPNEGPTPQSSAPQPGQWSGIRQENRGYTDPNRFSPDPPTWSTAPQLSPMQAARQQLKTTVRKIVPALLIFFVVEYIAAYGISAVISLILLPRMQLGMSGFQFPDNTYYGMSYGVYDLLTSYLPVLIGEAAAILYLRLRTRVSFRQLFRRPIIPKPYHDAPDSFGGADLTRRRQLPGGAWILFAALAGIGFSMIGQICAIFELNLLESIGFPYYSPDFSTTDYTLLETVLINLYVCVLGPVMEELIFRGFLLKGLQKHGVSFAAVFTAILFTLYHMNLVQLCVPMLMGLFLAVLAIRTDSLIPSICCHILNNTIATLGDYLMPADAVWSWVYLIIESALFIGILAIFWIFYGKHFSGILRWRNPVIRLSSQVGAAVSSWPTVVFIVIYILTIIASSLMTMFS